MVASLADPIIARIFGGVVINCNDTFGPASYDVHGLRFVFVPSADDTATYALDVESRDTESPPFLVQHFESTNMPFFELWTRLEVIAKLLGYPVLELVKENRRLNLHDEDISIRRVDTPTHWIAVGRR